MNEKELRRLHRKDLLQLLLLQSRETAKLQAKLEELTEQNARLTDERNRLCAWLDEKDAALAARGTEQLLLAPDGRGEPRPVAVNELLRAFEKTLGELLEQEQEEPDGTPPETEETPPKAENPEPIPGAQTQKQE